MEKRSINKKVVICEKGHCYVDEIKGTTIDELYDRATLNEVV